MPKQTKNHDDNPPDINQESTAVFSEVLSNTMLMLTYSNHHSHSTVAQKERIPTRECVAWPKVPKVKSKYQRKECPLALPVASPHEYAAVITQCFEHNSYWQKCMWMLKRDLLHTSHVGYGFLQSLPLGVTLPLIYLGQICKRFKFHFGPSQTWVAGIHWVPGDSWMVSMCARV